MELPASSLPSDASATPSPSGEPRQHLTVRQRRQALAIRLLQTSSLSRHRFAMARRPSSHGARYCCVVNCHNSEKNTRGLRPPVKFYCFPGKWYEKERRQAWITAVCRFNPDGTQWTPKANTRICSRHFIGNRKNESSRHPSYVPTIFPAAHKEKAADQDRGQRVCDGTVGAPAEQPGRIVGMCHECSVCGQRFVSRKIAKIHLATHTCEEPYNPPDSSQKFVQKANVSNHQHVQTFEIRFACELCASTFYTNKSLNRHKQLHASGVDFFHCPECGKTLTQRRSFQQHLKWHKKEKPYLCHLCPATFVYDYERDNHVFTHMNKKPHHCSLCPKSFVWKNSLKEHMRRAHGEGKTAVINATTRVEMVSPSSPTAAPIVTTVDIKAEPSSPPSTPPPGPVDMDGKGPFEPAVLLPRIVSVTTLTGSTGTSGGSAVMDNDLGICGGTTEAPLKKPRKSAGSSHESDVRGRCFANKDSAKKTSGHAHEQETVFPPVCGQNIAPKFELLKHQRTGGKPHTCPICIRKFTQKWHLLQHHRIHTGEKPHACLVCGRKFTQKSTLIRHQHVHTNRALYACPVCPSKFFEKSSLDRHKQLHTSG